MCQWKNGSICMFCNHLLIDTQESSLYTSDGKKIILNFNFKDTKQEYGLTLENSVLSYVPDKKLEQPDATITLNRSTLDNIALGMATVDEKVVSGEIQIEGKKEALDELLALLDRFEFWFNIVTP